MQKNTINQRRAFHILQKQVNYPASAPIQGIVTRQQFIEAAAASANFFFALKMLPKKTFNRRKYNRMTDWREQQKYEKECNAREEKICVQNKLTGSYFVLNKTESEYAKVCIIAHLLTSLAKMDG
ncbi:MAG: hypothetical protein AAF902_03640 [Chloroflexota bacterium]